MLSKKLMYFISHNIEQTTVLVVSFTANYLTDAHHKNVSQNIIVLSLVCVCPTAHGTSKSFPCDKLHFNPVIFEMKKKSLYSTRQIVFGLSLLLL